MHFNKSVLVRALKMGFIAIKTFQEVNADDSIVFESATLCYNYKYHCLLDTNHAEVPCNLIIYENE